MKLPVLLSLSILITQSAMCQKHKTIFYNANWKILDENTDVSYFRTIVEDTSKPGLYHLNDFYLSGNKQMTGKCDCRDSLIEIKDLKECGKVGKRYGEWIYYYESGAKSAHEVYVNGKRAGKFYSWYESGKVKSEDLIDSISGLWTRMLYYESGALVTKGELKNNKLHGHFQQWFENGQIALDTYYEYGERTKYLKTWYENGQQQNLLYLNEKHERIGEGKSWYESGKIKSITIYSAPNKVKSFTEWFENGQKSYVKNEEGLFTWYENGQKNTEGFYKEGKKHKTWREWYDNGQLKKESRFKNGECDGKVKHYDEKGNLTAEYECKE